MTLKSDRTMTKDLKELDPVYSNVKEYMTVTDRLTYCEQLIKDTEYFTKTQSKFLDDKTKEKYDTLIIAAQNEIKLLQKQSDKD